MGSSLSRIQAIIYDRDFPRFPRPADHGSMRFGHIRDNVHAVRPDRLPQFRFASHHFEFLVDTKASFRRCCGLFTNVFESK